MTRISTGPLADSSFSPSCSFNAVKIERPVESSDVTGPVALACASMAHFKCKSNPPASPVLSMTGLSSPNRDNLPASFAMLTPGPSSVRFSPSAPNRGKSQKTGCGAPGTGSGGCESTERECNCLLRQLHLYTALFGSQLIHWAFCGLAVDLQIKPLFKSACSIGPSTCFTDELPSALAWMS